MMVITNHLIVVGPPCYNNSRTEDDVIGKTMTVEWEYDDGKRHIGATVPFQKIRIRDDDVLVPSRQWPDSVKRFKGFHNIITQDPKHFLHVATILVTEIQQFPEIL